MRKRIIIKKIGDNQYCSNNFTFTVSGLYEAIVMTHNLHLLLLIYNFSIFRNFAFTTVRDQHILFECPFICFLRKNFFSFSLEHNLFVMPLKLKIKQLTNNCLYLN